MNKEFIPYEQALELKELGFLQDDTTCRCVQNEGFEEEKLGWGILYQQAFRWFREKYNWVGGIRRLSTHGRGFLIGDFNKDDNNSFMIKESTYEEAELACLKKLIEIAKTTNT